MTPTFKATIDERHRLKFDNLPAFSMYVARFRPGADLEVIVRPKRRPRTTGKPDELGNQNGYYWSTVLPIISKELGYLPDELHEIFLSMFAPYNYKDIVGQKVPVKIRSSQMDTAQFSEYVETIRAKMAELNITIPDPEKYV